MPGEEGKENLSEVESQEKGYPHLEEKLRDIEFKSKGFVQRLLIHKDIMANIVRVAQEAVNEGTVTDEWYINEQESKKYKVQLKESEADQLLKAVDRFMDTPLHGGFFDETLSDELSSLLSGNAERERYIEIKEDNSRG